MIDVLEPAVAAAVSLALAGGLGRAAFVRAARRYEDALTAARHEATHDGLTGALTRGAFARELERCLAAANEQRPLALLAIDVDEFGQVNKLHGHAAGDALLVHLVSATLGAIREGDAIGRLGGDEFAVLVDGRDPVAVAERVLSALRPHGRGEGIDVSIGIATAPADGTTVAALLRAADVAMRRAKRTGKARIVAYSGESLADRDDARVRRALVELIEQQRISLVTQPIVDLRTGTIHAFEALARFGIPGDLSTGELFALAGRVGMREELDLACLAKGIALLPQRPRGTLLTVNVSSSLLADPRATLLLGDGDLQGLVLEITEEALVRDYAALQSSVQPLLERGVRIAVDDMGAGYSGLRHAIDLHPSYLKLDRALVHGIDRDPKRAALLDALLRYAQHAGSHIVAEGVETEAELTTLTQLGVPLAQGYLLARPAPPWPSLTRTPVPAGPSVPVAGAAARLPTARDVATTGPELTAEQAHARFTADAALETLIVLDEDRRVLGLLTRRRLLARIGQRFGFALYGQRSMLHVADRQFLSLPATTPWPELVARAMARPADTRHDPILLHDVEGRLLRHLTIRDLLATAEPSSRRAAAA